MLLSSFSLPDGASLESWDSLLVESLFKADGSCCKVSHNRGLWVFSLVSGTQNDLVSPWIQWSKRRKDWFQGFDSKSAGRIYIVKQVSRILHRKMSLKRCAVMKVRVFGSHNCRVFSCLDMMGFIVEALGLR